MRTSTGSIWRRAAAILGTAAMTATMVVAGTGTAAADPAQNPPAPPPAAAATPQANADCAPFPDVSADNAHCRTIAWLAGTGITKPADGLFRPEDSVRRGQMTAFLFRLQHPGEPQPECTRAPFSDVTQDHAFCGYIQWAKQERLVFGYADGTFGPNKPMTRGAMMALLYRVQVGGPAPECSGEPFWDVTTKNRFCGYIQWARETQLTRGVGKGCEFNSAGDTTRGATATLFYRLDNPGPAARDCGPKPMPQNDICAPTARACVDLTHNESWLQLGGELVYGPVPITAGMSHLPTRPGKFHVFWKNRHHVSSIYGTPMPYSVFFDGDIAFHQGSLKEKSHGCIHLSWEAAERYWNHLGYGAQVHVWGRTP